MPKTLLLADDSVTIQKVVGITFANEDVNLVTVDNGDDALARAREIRPDLIMADIGMPGMTGYELCAAVRATADIATVPVLLLTGTFESYDEARAREVAASGHISKPFEAQALVDMVHQLLTQAPAATAPSPPAAPMLTEAPTEVPSLPSFGLDDLPSADSLAAADPLPRAEVPDLLGEPTTGSATPSPLTEIFGSIPEAPQLIPETPNVDLGGAESTSADEADLANSETAFFDPLAQVTPPPVIVPDADLPEAPLEFEDVGDLLHPDPRAMTSPTYADGEPIEEESSHPEMLSAAAAEDPSDIADTPFGGRMISPADMAVLEEEPEYAPPPAVIEPEPQVLAASPAPEIAEPAPEPPQADEWLPEIEPELDMPAVEMEAPTQPEAATQPDLKPEPIAAPLQDEASPLQVPDQAATAAASEPDLPLPRVDPLPAPEPAEAAAPALEEPPAAPEPEPISAPEPVATAPLPEPALELRREVVHEAIQKVAWDALGPLSEQLVEEFTRRVETIVWEVVPPLAERLIREEIDRLKAGAED